LGLLREKVVIYQAGAAEGLRDELSLDSVWVDPEFVCSVVYHISFKNVCSYLLGLFYHKRSLKSTGKLYCMCIFEWLQPFNANSSQPLAEAGVFFAYYDKSTSQGDRS
jgi:hypothetical protein